MNINDEYYVMTWDNRKPFIDLDQADDMDVEFDEDVIRPVHMEIDDDNWDAGLRPQECMYIIGGELLISNALKEKYFYKYDLECIKLHKAYITSPDGEEYFEGYWLVMIQQVPSNWLDVEKSDLTLDPNADPLSKYESINSYQLNQKILEKLPLEERLCFDLPYSEYGATLPIVHKEMVDALALVEDRTVVFVPISEVTSQLMWEEFPKGTI